MFKNLLYKNNRIILNYLNQNEKQLRCIYFRRNIVFSSSSATAAEIDIQFDNIPVERIRNFSIIAHVDHGKSTLADRLLEITGAISKNSGKTQVLDSLEVEQQRGITVKAQTASLIYHYDNKPYLLNLIDTPGHVDFCNEVSRSLAACNGVILLVDANHGVQAQTVANYHLAMSKNLHILPVLNKIDLKNADPERVCEELYTLFKIPKENILKISAKFGTGTEQLLENIVKYFPCPNVNRTNLFRGLLFDSWYDRYRGALNLILVNDGEITIGQEIVSYHTKKTYEIKTLSVMCPTEVNVKRLVAGQVGLIGCNMRNSSESLIGDTFFIKHETVKPLPGFKPLQPMVYAGIFPTDQTHHVSLRSAIDKLILNDSVVTIAKDSSPALGQGWRLGFLGLLHMEVFCQRLQQEHDAEPIITAPSVTYKIKLKPTKKITENVNDILFISNPVFLPDPQLIDEFYEPFVLGTIITPTEYVGSIISMCVDHRGVQLSSSNIDDRRILMTYSLPLSEIVIDFHDKLKSVSSGYASFDYEGSGYHITNIVKLTILLNGKQIEELSRIVHVSKVNRFARDMVLRLKDQIPRQMVQIAIQACVGGKVLARETITAYRKDVTSKLYGGDVTRRMKLLKQQSEGKKKMRSIATIRVPHETFINILKR